LRIPFDFEQSITYLNNERALKKIITSAKFQIIKQLKETA